HDYFVLRADHGRQRVEARGKVLRPITGTDDDADARGARDWQVRGESHHTTPAGSRCSAGYGVPSGSNEKSSKAVECLLRLPMASADAGSISSTAAAQSGSPSGAT